MTIPHPAADIWSDWLLHARHGDDGVYAQAMQAVVTRYADKVLDGAVLAPGMRLLDVGCGDGLVAFRALERLGTDLEVILTDISTPLLQHAAERAGRLGVAAQCVFKEQAADSLPAVDDGSVDVVTTRAVLAYVADKQAALSEFYRVLKPGGRISLAEPIFHDDALVACALRSLVESLDGAAPDRFIPLLHRWKAALFPDTSEKMASSPLTNYTERDLLRLVQAAGFGRARLELHIDVAPSAVPSWSAFLDSSPHPLAPTHGTVLAEQFNPEERQFFEQVLRPSVEAGQWESTDRVAYLTAVKPTLA